MIIIMILPFLFILVYPFSAMLSSLKGNPKPHKKEKGIAQKGFIGILYTFFLYFLVVLGFYLNSFALEAGRPLRIFSMTDATQAHYASLSNEYIFSMIVFFVLGVIAYGLLGSIGGALSPILYVISGSILIIHIIITIIYVTHTGFSHYDESFPTASSILFLQIGNLSLSFLYVAMLKDSLDSFLALQERNEEEEQTNRLLSVLYRVTSHYQRIPYIWALCSLPVILIIQFVLVLFGQRPDSFIRVFMDTSSFNYSAIPAPKPEIIEGDGHYLCTVSARGHKKVVKPLRAGIRHNKKIVVNRQLLVANAFENILEEYTPKIHLVIRTMYNKYGYPISKHIHTKWMADIVYLLMKPLEWFFLIVLYTVDKNPENRIHTQYSELRK